MASLRNHLEASMADKYVTGHVNRLIQGSGEDLPATKPEKARKALDIITCVRG